MKKFVLTPTAKTDVRGILDFLKGESPAATIRVRTALRDAIRLIADRPGIGHVREDLADETLRFWPVFSYLVVSIRSRARFFLFDRFQVVDALLQQHRRQLTRTDRLS